MSSIDVENPVPDAKQISDIGIAKGGNVNNHVNNELSLKSASGLLLTWSILAMIEGTIRLVRNANPPGGLNPPGDAIPPLAFLVGGIAEVIFGGAGLLLAVGIFIFGWRNPAYVMSFLGLQFVTGWFVFILFVIANPIKRIVDLETGILGMSLGMTRFNVALGMITSIVWCAALQAGQFTFGLTCLSILQDKPEKQSKQRLRAIVWTGLAAVAGMSMTLAGITLVATLDSSGPYFRPDIPVFPPHIAIYPALILACGVVTLCWGAIGVAGAVTSNKMILSVFHYGWFSAFAANVITFALVLGKEPAGVFAFASAQHVLLSLVFTLLPVVFTRKLVGDEDYNSSTSYAS